MIHLANSNQISMQSPYQTLAAQPPAQIPNPYPNYTPTPNSNHPNPNPNANPANRRNNGKRLKRDDDWDICWDYLSPKGCTRDTCRWRHGNPKIDQRQIAKRRKRYMEQNRRGDRNNNHRNSNKRRKRNNNSNIWGHHHPQIMHGPPPPPPYFTAQGHGQQAPPQMPAPQQGQSAQDYYAQYYAAYGYMQPTVPPQQQQPGTVAVAVAVDPQQRSDEKKDGQKDGALASVSGVAYAQYPGYGYYGGYAYPYGGYPPYGYNPAVAQKGKEEEKRTDDVAVVADTDKAADGNIEANVKDANDVNTEEIDKFINNDNVAQEEKEKEAEHTVLAAKDNGVAIGAVVGDADIDEDIDLNHNENELPTQPSAGKPAIDENVLNTDKDEVTCNNSPSDTENKDVNIDKNEKLRSPLPSASPPRQCPSDCKCDICAYKQTFQQPQNDNIPTNPPQNTQNPQTIDNKPKRHPMFDGMDYKNNDQDLSSDDADDNDIDIDATPLPASNPWSAWHEQYQSYTQPPNAPNPQQILLQAQKNALLAQQQLQNTLLRPKRKKKRKSRKKKGIEHSVKWLYIISDSERECYGSLCRGQFDAITTTKWLTSLYESAEWGADVKDRSRSAQIMDGPAANHIAWYTLSGCNCTLLRDVQSAENANVGFPHWLQQITAAVMKICSVGTNAPNSCEIFYFENKASRWNWHSYCQDAIFGVNGDGVDGGGEGHVGQTIHLLIGHRRQFKFAPRKTKAIPGDEEKCVFLENGDVFVTCGKFTSDYVVKIDCEENTEYDSGVLSKAHSSMYIVWRWIAKHNGQCLQKVNF